LWSQKKVDTLDSLKNILAYFIQFNFYFFLFLLCPFALGDNLELLKIESAFIYKFTNFIEWPHDAPANAGDKFTICVVGSSPVQQTLEEIAALKTVNGEKLEIKGFSDGNLPKFCHIALITTKNSETFENILKNLKGRKILVISHADGFGVKGSMINFFSEGDRLRFEINRKAVEAEGIKVNSRLLNLAKTIE
jgi:YfiR/HmsC-like